MTIPQIVDALPVEVSTAALGQPRAIGIPAGCLQLPNTCYTDQRQEVHVPSPGVCRASFPSRFAAVPRAFHCFLRAFHCLLRAMTDETVFSTWIVPLLLP